MHKITTDDCKIWLQNKYPGTSFDKWKRVSKYLEQSIITREFKHNEIHVFLQEKNGVLFEKYKDLNIKKILELNQNLYYLKKYEEAKAEFLKYINFGSIFNDLLIEFTDNEDNQYSTNYSLISSKIIQRIYPNIVNDFVFSIYEVYDGETSIEISDIYGICGGDSGQTCAFIFDNLNGISPYLESKDIEISGFSETTISVVDDNVSILKKYFIAFGLHQFDQSIHTEAYISQEPI